MSSAGRAARDKGARGEREVADMFREAGFECARTPNSGGLHVAGDLAFEVDHGIHVEVKRAEHVRVWDWLAQAEIEAGDAQPVLAFRRNRSDWYAAVPLDYLLYLLATVNRKDPT